MKLAASSFALVVSHLALVTIAVLSALVLSHLALGTAAYAASPPNPKPCENAINTDDANLTNQSIDPISTTAHGRGTMGDTVTATGSISINIDFSKLQAIFGKNNSDYLESKFQDEPHYTTDLMNLKSADFNQFHGPGQKTTPKVLIDQLKVKYVKYIYDQKPTLPEAANKYTDFNGQNPHTIYELITDPSLHFPYPPNPPEGNESKDQWLATWGKYWEKIPTTYSEFYYGQLVFYETDDKANQCMPPFRTIYFVMPEFYRTQSTSGQLNQVIVPRAAQSSTNSFLSSIIDTTKTIAKKCLQPFTENPISKTLQKAIKITLSIFQPPENVYAATPDCVYPSPPPTGKESGAPFCALPLLGPNGQPQLQLGDECKPEDNPNQLDKGNPNVNCTFVITWTEQRHIPDGFDSCRDPNHDGIFDCDLGITIHPIFRIPWLTEIWNHTLYNGTGQPGVYSFFSPKSVSGIADPKVISLPGQTNLTQTENDVKQHYIGATDCSKELVRDLALKPKALQTYLNISPSSKCSSPSP